MDAHLVFEDIDPAIAQVYLGKNIDHNRMPINDRIERMARDMAKGDWIPTADPIKFNKDGKLIDGQHRLRAIMLSQTTQRVLVARDLAEDAVYVIDTGAPRSAAQALKIANVDSKNNSTVVAAAQIIHAYDIGVFKNTASAQQGKDRMTHTELLHWLDEHSAEVQVGIRMAEWVRRSLPLPGSVVAAAYVILARVDAEQASLFFGRIREGSAGFDTADPVSTLTRRVYQDKMNNRRIVPAMALFYIIRTWNAWRDEEAMHKLQAASASGNAALPKPR